MINYDKYESLKFERPSDGVLLITINRPQAANAMTREMHTALTKVWLDVGDDPQTRAVVITGAGKAFCSGADLRVDSFGAGDYDERAALLDEARDMVYNMVNLDKPIISAINGVAVGAGLTVAMMADITIMAEDARIFDGHTRFGVAAGDHSVLIWPLLCGMAKAKYYLLTSEPIDGKEAERIKLVTMAVPADQLLPKAIEVARRLGSGAQHAIRFTKRALNHWLRAAGPAFEHSLALEQLNFFSDDCKEGIAAVKEKRTPKFPSTR